MERATLFQGLILAAETSLGTLPVTPKPFRLPSVMAEVKPHLPNKTFKGRGAKGALGKTRTKEWTEIGLSGPFSYDECGILLLSHLGVVTPTDYGTSTTAKEWITQATAKGKDVPLTFTVQVGDATDGASQIAGCVVTDFSISVDDNGCTFTATLAGRKLADSFGDEEFPFFDTPAELTTYPIHEAGVGLFYGDDPAALTGLTHLIKFQWDSKKRWTPAFFRDPTQASFSGFVEGNPDMTMKITCEEDSQANDLLSRARADGSTFLALTSTGPVISAGDGPTGIDSAYLVDILWPVVVVTSPQRADEQDVYGGEYDLEAAYNPTHAIVKATFVNQVLAVV